MKVKKTGTSIYMKIVIWAIIAYAGVSLVTLRPRLAAANREKLELEEKIAQAERVNEELKYQIENSGNESVIADVARSKLGLVWPGEIIFYDISK